MGHDFIDDLLHTLDRVVKPDVKLLREILIIGGMPEESENLRYLSFNRQVSVEDNRTLEFSVVAVLNNRRATRFRLEGMQKKLSQIVFSTRWTRNPLDLFLNNVRCDADLMDILSLADSHYSLLGILQVEEVQGSGYCKCKCCFIRPVIAVPGVRAEHLDRIVAFEEANEIVRSKITGLMLYRKTGRQTAR